jgi:hypothetical protein
MRKIVANTFMTLDGVMQARTGLKRTRQEASSRLTAKFQQLALLLPLT